MEKPIACNEQNHPDIEEVRMINVRRGYVKARPSEIGGISNAM